MYEIKAKLKKNNLRILLKKVKTLEGLDMVDRCFYSKSVLASRASLVAYVDFTTPYS